MNNLVEPEAVWIIVAVTGFLGLMGWINYLIMRWKRDMLMKLINGMRSRKNDPELDNILKKLG